jgi:hypothetical protein
MSNEKSLITHHWSFSPIEMKDTQFITPTGEVGTLLIFGVKSSFELL